VVNRSLPVSLGYQERDFEVVDYHLYRFDDQIYLRGPKPTNLEAGSYAVCLGAAQTFGCLVERPYSTLLRERLGLPILNLGIAGAGPAFFLRHPTLLDLANGAKFAVVQVMSGRSEDNSRFASGGLEILTRREDGARLGAEPAYRDLLERSPVEEVKHLVAETRERWITSYHQLLGVIQVPVVLFWFSKREPNYTEAYTDVHALFGEFPQLVNHGMIERIAPHADAYVACVTNRGSPERLRSRFTGEPVAVIGRKDLGARRQEFNSYYPSAQMHLDAADALEPACRSLVLNRGFVPGGSR
jgi:hypothetical protein